MFWNLVKTCLKIGWKFIKSKFEKKAERAKTGVVYKVLHPVYAVVPFFAGVDKYFNFITDWEKYASPLAVRATGLSAKTLMRIAGVAEMFIGAMIVVKPRLGLAMSATMYAGIIGNLLTMPKQLHLASLDATLMVSALMLILLVPGNA